jgi:Terminase large subunit, T4likevirus-type, N-terminal
MLADDPIGLMGDFAMACDPVLLARAVGIEPDTKQAALLRSSSRRVLLNCCRQWGKTTVTAAIATHEALYAAPAMIVLVSPSQVQSGELFKKVAEFWKRLPGAPEAEQESMTRLKLANGSRIVSLPGSERTTRGFSGATLVIMDEAARCDDELLASVMPMLAVTNGRFIALSTPKGRRGWFYETWMHGGDTWQRVSVPATECPRISAEFLEEQRRILGTTVFEQEYSCAFHDDNSSAFSSALIEQALVSDFAPFFLEEAA